MFSACFFLCKAEEGNYIFMISLENLREQKCFQPNVSFILIDVWFVYFLADFLHSKQGDGKYVTINVLKHKKKPNKPSGRICWVTNMISTFNILTSQFTVQ